jgi:uncharacterized SAM-binding protein YcdF (DUF218 family)
VTAYKTKRRRRLALFAAIAVLVGLSALFFFPQTFLLVQSDSSIADIIVVPGGDSEIRLAQAEKAFSKSNARFILLSGNGDCESNKAELLRKRIPASAILTECESNSTKENAEFSARILRHYKARRVILTTSWYHSRRALKTFQKFAPEITFISSPAPRRADRWKYERGVVYIEYLKILYYAFKWHVSPI